jgi:hypothetical protein
MSPLPSQDTVRAIHGNAANGGAVPGCCGPNPAATATATTSPLLDFVIKAAAPAPPTRLDAVRRPMKDVCPSEFAPSRTRSADDYAAHVKSARVLEPS